MQGLNNQNYNPGVRPKTYFVTLVEEKYSQKLVNFIWDKKFRDTSSYGRGKLLFLILLHQKPKNQRRPLPQPPKTITKSSDEQSLEKCAYCGQQGKSNLMVIQENKAPVRPKTLVCYICERKYGTKFWESIYLNAKKQPKSERRNPLTTPRGLWDLLNKEDIAMNDLITYNNGAFNKYNKETLVACKNCGRTLKPIALEHRIKACTVDNPFKTLDPVEEGGTVELVTCKKFGRKFLPSRVEKQERNLYLFQTTFRLQMIQACKNIYDLNQHVQICKNQCTQPIIYGDLSKYQIHLKHSKLFIRTQYLKIIKKLITTMNNQKHFPVRLINILLVTKPKTIQEKKQYQQLPISQQYQQQLTQQNYQQQQKVQQTNYGQKQQLFIKTTIKYKQSNIWKSILVE